MSERGREYQDYLQTPEWRAKREWALERAGRKCQVCNGTKQLDVHHRTYENLGAELPQDLTVLCRGCHSLFHEKSRGGDKRTARKGRVMPPPVGPERELLLLMTKDRDWIERVRERLGPHDLVDVRYRAVFEALLADHDLTHAPEKMVPEASRVLEELLADPTEISRAHRVFEESLSKILSTLLQERLCAVDHLLQNTLDEQQETRLLVEKARLSKERRELGRDWSPTVRRALKGA